MKVLVSVVSLTEAILAVEGKADIIDIKNPSEGSLGAQYPWIIKEIAGFLQQSGALCSVALGDLPYKPGTASLAAMGAAGCNVDYIKAGLYGIRNYSEAYTMIMNIVDAVKMVNTNALVVAAGYADYNRFGGIGYQELSKAAKDAKAHAVMIDTAIKDGRNLFDALTFEQIKEFVDMSHDAGLQVALAGSIRIEHIRELVLLNPDIIGIRGAVCEKGNRESGIVKSKVVEFLESVRTMNN